MTFTKRDRPEAIAHEAAGLRELGRAAEAGGVPAATLVSVGERELETEFLTTTTPTAAGAHEFGRRLAITHAFDGPRVYGEAPPGFDLPEGAMGKADLPLVAPGSPPRRFGEFYAEDRILPYLEPSLANGSITKPYLIEALCEKLKDGDFDSDDSASLLHGDLWSGNVMWTKQGCVLIDPACQGGHRESDLAQLFVFGAPYADEIVAAYQEESPLEDGWLERRPLHQLHILIVHAALFGGSYGRQCEAVASSFTA